MMGAKKGQMAVRKRAGEQNECAKDMCVIYDKALFFITEK